MVSDLLDDKASDWWSNPSLSYEEIAEKLMDMEKTSKFLKLKMGAKTQQTTIPTKQKSGDDRKASNSFNKNNHKEQKTTANDVLRAEFGTEIRANPTISTLKKWKAKHPYCIFHPDLRAGGPRKPHPFLYCNKVKEICTRANCEDVL